VNAVESWKTSFANWKKSELHAVDCIDYPPEVLPAVWEVLDGVMSALPEGQKIFPEDFPNGLYTTQGHCKYGYIGFNHSRRATDEEKEIVVRFAKEFGRLYQRFLDIQKAESQAREAQIEGALERVRSKAMAMHSSDDLADTVEILYKELDTLQVHALRFGHAKVNSDTKIVELHTATDLGKVVGQLKLEGHPLLEKIYEHYLAKEDLYYALQGAEMKSYYSILGRAIDVPTPPMDTVQHGYFFFLGDTANYAWSDKALDEEELKVYRRLITVLNLTYKRYEELKNAETQAREAQIEGALERVRSKTMAMHNSEDVGITVVTLFDEVLKLGLDKSIRCGIGILEGTEQMETWSATSYPNGEVDLKVGKLDMTIHPLLVEVKNAWLNGKKGFNYELKGKEVAVYYDALNNAPEYPFHVDLKTLPNKTYHNSFVFSSGILFAFTENPISEDAVKVLNRFASVFGQTYRRYLDLQKAEEQARQATKQASLDRVRGQIASMRSTADLDSITPLIWDELTTLRVPFIRCGVFIINEATQIVNAYLSSPKGESLGVLNLPFTASTLTSASVEYWRQKKVLHQHWNREEFMAWTTSLMEQGLLKNKASYQGTSEPPESLDLHFIPFDQGMLYVGSEAALSSFQIDLVQALANAFSVAYARYEDFAELEKAKESVETTLNELKATQNQLVQSEKMASLGELTAGIAHEIQNPLNFVNNFSEVSKELLEEMMEEMEKGDMEEVKALVEDVIQNLEKIVHHGKRADGIVKGMLQHSRSSSGEKEPTDINILADEYLRLAYHGLRAKDKSFNASLETHFDESIGKVNLIAQDMGRVILNLITNAFYVVKEKKEKHPEGYEPTVTVITRKQGNQVVITVKDNGNGIPDAIKEKIFQPFFTTKPTGQGTGLGLSMSYDIVTKGHGGELKVVTEEGTGSEFTISLPLNQHP
jgi:signal transduction histidine kinase